MIHIYKDASCTAALLIRAIWVAVGLRTAICIEPLLDNASLFFYQMLRKLKRLRVRGVFMDEDVSKHLSNQVMETSTLEEGDKVLLMKENIIKAWLFCHEQRI